MRVVFEGSAEKVRRQMREFLGLDVEGARQSSPPEKPRPSRVLESTGRVKMQAPPVSPVEAPASGFGPHAFFQNRGDDPPEALAKNEPPQRSEQNACHFCGKSFDKLKARATHVRFCPKNPDRRPYPREKIDLESEASASPLKTSSDSEENAQASEESIEENSTTALDTMNRNSVGEDWTIEGWDQV